MDSLDHACLVCGQPIGFSDKIVASTNRHANRVALHEDCLIKLRAERDVRDGFACDSCKTKFTPDSFPFVYGYEKGIMGAGSGYQVLKGQTCPNCGYAFPQSSFRLCTLCGGGIIEDTAVRAEESSGVKFYHRACNPKTIRSIGRHLPNASHQPGPQPQRIIPPWAWIIAGVAILAVLLLLRPK